MSQNPKIETPLKNSASSNLEIAEIDGYARHFYCPCCEARLQFKTRMQIFGVSAVASDGEPIKNDTPTKKT